MVHQTSEHSKKEKKKIHQLSSQVLNPNTGASNIFKIGNMITLRLKTLVLSTLALFLLFLVHGHECKIVQFIFGDSLSDVGNNNYLSKSLARANLPWYGIDFGNGLPNGRFSNGRTVADIIGTNFFLSLVNSINSGITQVEDKPSLEAHYKKKWH